MTRPRGESHHAASLTLKKASSIKRKVANGVAISQLASEIGLPYQLIYRIARGKTWPDAAPKGDILGDSSREAPGRKRKVTVNKQYALWKKRREGVGTKKLAAATGMSTPSVRRLILEFETMLAIRVSRLQLTSGSYEVAMKRYGLSRAEAEALDAKAVEIEIPLHTNRLVERDFPKLEKLLNGRSKS